MSERPKDGRAGSTPPDDNLKVTASRNALWSLVSFLGGRIFTIAGTAVLARRLEPSDFGVVGLVGIMTGLVLLLGNFGLGAAIIYRKDVDDIHLSTSYWFNVGVGLTLMVLTITVAPLAANYFHNELVRPVAWWLSLNFLINSLSWAHGCMLTKNLRFRVLAFIRIGSVLTRAAVAILLVTVFDAGVWGLVFGDIAMNCFASASRLFAYRWRPAFTFCTTRFRQLFRYGINLTGSSILGYFASNIDYILIGRLLDSTQLGFYQFSYSIPHMVQQGFATSLGRVLFPVFCKVQDDNARFVRGYVRTIQVISLLSFPLLIGLAVSAAPFVRVLYGDGWDPVIVPLQILAFSAVARCVFVTNGPVLNAKGRPDIGLKWGAVHFVLTITTVLLFSRFGVIGIAAGMSISAYYSVFPAWLVARMVGLPFHRWLAASGPAALCSGIMAGVLILVGRFLLASPDISNVTRLLSLVLLGGAVYIGALRLIFPGLFRDVLELARDAVSPSRGEGPA